MWAWMEGKLHIEYMLKNIEEMNLRNMFDHYEASMQRGESSLVPLH